MGCRPLLARCACDEDPVVEPKTVDEWPVGCAFAARNVPLPDMALFALVLPLTSSRGYACTRSKCRTPYGGGCCRSWSVGAVGKCTAATGALRSVGWAGARDRAAHCGRSLFPLAPTALSLVLPCWCQPCICSSIVACEAETQSELQTATAMRNSVWGGRTKTLVWLFYRSDQETSNTITIYPFHLQVATGLGRSDVRLASSQEKTRDLLLLPPPSPHRSSSSSSASRATRARDGGANSACGRRGPHADRADHRRGESARAARAASHCMACSGVQSTHNTSLPPSSEIRCTHLAAIARCLVSYHPTHSLARSLTRPWISVRTTKDSTTGLLLAGVGNVDDQGNKNFFVVDSKVSRLGLCILFDLYAPAPTTRPAHAPHPSIHLRSHAVRPCRRLTALTYKSRPPNL